MGEGSASTTSPGPEGGESIPAKSGSGDPSPGRHESGAAGHGQLLGRILPGARSNGAESRPATAPLNLAPGEWAEVRPIDEIGRTLDGQGRHRGLYFMPEMQEFCGRRFRVMKQVRTIRLESSGELRRLTDPAVLLEGVYCSGEQHGGCDRACLHMWRELWLRRVDGGEAERALSAGAPPGS